MSTHAALPGPTRAMNDWSRPIHVSRFGVMLETAVGDPFERLTPLGHMAWSDGTDVDPAATLPGWPTNPRTAQAEVQAAYDATNLYVRVICEESQPDGMLRDNPEMWRNDHVAVSIDPRHDHWRFCQLTILPGGRMETAWNTVNCQLVPGDLSVKKESGPAPKGIVVQTQQLSDRWIVDVTIPWRSLGLSRIEPGQCVGLNVSRWRAIGCEQLMQWSPTFGLVHDARCFGDLYLGAPAAILQEIQVGGPNWGPNRGYARFVASQPFQAWIETGESVEPVDPKPAQLQANQYGLARYELNYRIDPRDIMRGRMTLKWGAAGAASSASYVFGWKRSVLLTHAAGREDKPVRPTDGAAPDFFARMCDYLLARLPRLRREAGRFLVSDDGLRIDLLGPDPLVPIAEAVAKNVEGQADQLAACALVLCQAEVLISSGSRAGASARSSPAGVIWTGGTFCDTYSMIVAELVDRVAALQGWKIPSGLVYMLRPEGASLEWPNHFWGGAWLGHGVTILDAELGRFFYRRDGRTLATLDDMFDDPSLAEASGIGLGDYFRLHTRKDVVIRYLPRWREIRPV